MAQDGLELSVKAKLNFHQSFRHSFLNTGMTNTSYCIGILLKRFVELSVLEAYCLNSIVLTQVRLILKDIMVGTKQNKEMPGPMVHTGSQHYEAEAGEVPYVWENSIL